MCFSISKRRFLNILQFTVNRYITDLYNFASLGGLLGFGNIITLDMFHILGTYFRHEYNADYFSY